jgi:hypothetical protein
MSSFVGKNMSSFDGRGRSRPAPPINTVRWQ